MNIKALNMMLNSNKDMEELHRYMQRYKDFSQIEDILNNIELMLEFNSKSDYKYGFYLQFDSPYIKLCIDRLYLINRNVKTLEFPIGLKGSIILLERLTTAVQSEDIVIDVTNIYKEGQAMLDISKEARRI